MKFEVQDQKNNFSIKDIAFRFFVFKINDLSGEKDCNSLLKVLYIILFLTNVMLNETFSSL